MPNNRTTGTRVGKAVADAADIMLQLRRLEGSRRLSANAFLRQALETAGIGEKRVAELEKTILHEPGLDEARAFTRRMAGQFRQSGWTTPPPAEKSGQMLRVYGSEQASAQLASVGCSEAGAIAVAAKIAAEKHPEAFGSVESWPEHTERVEKFRTKLETAYAAIREAVTLADLEIEHETLNATDRAAGFCRIRFRAWPAISPVQPDWQRRLVETALAADAGQRAA